MTDTPDNWVLIEAAKRSKWIHATEAHEIREKFNNIGEGSFRALCDMIAKHEQKPIDRELLCAREAVREWFDNNKDNDEWIGLRAIELWEEGFGK